MLKVNDNIQHVVDTSVTTSLVPSNQPKLYVVTNDTQREIFLEEKIGQLSFPVQHNIAIKNLEKDLGYAGLVVVPIEGGGRGPIINYGETITLSLLFSLLNNTLTKEQLSPELLGYLDRIPYDMPNIKDQHGYASHNELITLNHSWAGYPPIIELSIAPGSFMHVIHTQVGVDPNCITYVEIPKQEAVYGHSGVVNNNQFIIKAAILEKTDPITKSLNWVPPAIKGPPLTILTEESLTTNTTIGCMGLRIKGKIGLTNELVYEVSGAMYAQVSVDDGPWVNIAVLHWHFKENNSGLIEEKFDEIFVYDHMNHHYKFRGRLVTNSSDEVNRELTGHIHIDTVTEFGSGEVLSNDLLIKWASKEKL